MIYTICDMEVIYMLTAKIFESGRSQAVRIPKEYRFSDELKEVYINKVGDIVMLTPVNSKWAPFVNCLNSDDSEFDVEVPEELEVENRESL